MTKCGACGKFLSGGATCTKCKAVYHRQCVNISSNQTPKNWLCPCCLVNLPRQDNTNTPLKAYNVDLEPEQSPELLDENNDQRTLIDEIRALRNDMNTFRSDFMSFRQEVREEINDLRSICQRCDDKMDGFTQQIDMHEARFVALESSCQEIENLKTQLCNLKQELGNREQLALSNDIEITGVTEQKGESAMHISLLIVTKIGLNIDERDIVEAHRVGPVRPAQDGKQSPRPIVLRLTRRVVREQVLRAARARRNLTTGDIGVAGTPRPIYVNERLTKDNRLLFGRARALCKQNNWNYAWTRDGKVLVREADKKPALRVRSEGDFARIFNYSANGK